jgi:pseudouridine synthase
MALRINKFFAPYFSRRHIDDILKWGSHRVQVFSPVDQGSHSAPVTSSDIDDYWRNPAFSMTNGSPGMSIHLGKDVVFMDGKLVNGAAYATGGASVTGPEFSESAAAAVAMSELISAAVVVKLFKPRGIECTCNLDIPNNIVSYMRYRVKNQLDALADGRPSARDPATSARQGKGQEQALRELLRRRLFPIGRLDKDSTGVLLLTDYGPLNQALCKPSSRWADEEAESTSSQRGGPSTTLRPNASQKDSKVYHVWVTKAVTDEHLAALRAGVLIRSEVNRGGGLHKVLEHRTLPCGVKRLTGKQASANHHQQKGAISRGGDDPGPLSEQQQHCVEITLSEGRNRQVRRMMNALGYRVLRLHRIAFCGVGLTRGMRPGDFEILKPEERLLLLAQ